jgi:hypothetical protein
LHFDSGNKDFELKNSNDWSSISELTFSGIIFSGFFKEGGKFLESNTGYDETTTSVETELLEDFG